MKIISIAVIGCAIAVFAEGCAKEVTKVEETGLNSRSGSGSLAVTSTPTPEVIERGDSLQVNVWDYPEFSARTMVGEDGTIRMPFIGVVSAAGKTREQFQSEVTQALAPYIKQTIKVEVYVSTSATQNVAVVGAVGKQNDFPLATEEPLVDVLSKAGGAIPESDLSHVKIIPHGGTGDAVEVDLARALESGTTDQLPKVHPGDTVFVPSKENILGKFADFIRDTVFLFGFLRALY